MSEIRNMIVRSVEHRDMDALKAVIEACNLFPAGLLDGMVKSYFRDPEPSEIWLTCDDVEPRAVAYCAPERMTDGTWNLLLIAVHPDHQKKGLGAALVERVVSLLKARGARLLLVETSALEEFAGARAFYLSCGFEEEVRIREVYQSGEDKVVFRKSMIE